MKQNIKWGGGSYAIAFNNNRQEQSDLLLLATRCSTPILTAAYSQPLLRNFRTDATRTQLKITKLNQEMSETNPARDHRSDGRQRAQRVLGSRVRHSG